MEVPYGYCHCGCGERTKRATVTDRRRGWAKGEPIRYVPGHQRRKSPVEYVVDENGCWVWQRAQTGDGYGSRWVPEEGRTRRAHIVAYERAKGSVPDGLELDHLCRNRACVNPDHLEPVTRAENTRRGALTSLTPDDVRLIRESTEPSGTVAQRLGVSRRAVRNIRDGTRWASVMTAGGQ